MLPTRHEVQRPAWQWTAPLRGSYDGGLWSPGEADEGHGESVKGVASGARVFCIDTDAVILINHLVYTIPIPYLHTASPPEYTAGPADSCW